MSLNASPGPNINWGQSPAIPAGSPPADYNQDYAPSLDGMGRGLIDPRFGYTPGGTGNGSAQAFGFGPGVNYVVLDQVPSTAAVNNIAAAANPASGTPMTLVSSTGAGVTVMTAAYANKATGLSVPACLALDGLPGFVAFGQSLALQFFDPTKSLSRAVSVTGVGSGSGGTVTIKGYDLYGQPMTQTITLGAGANTVNSTKAFKFVQSVTPNFTDTHAISVGTADVYGLPLLASSYGYVNATFNNAPVTSPTFVAGVATTPSATTGDVRGTIVVTSDGTKRLQVMQGVSLANLATLTPALFSGLYGATQF